jgi:hypothetical protein
MVPRLLPKCIIPMLSFREVREIGRKKRKVIFSV